jgi:hypothetical protein
MKIFARVSIKSLLIAAAFLVSNFVFAAESILLPTHDAQYASSPFNGLQGEQRRTSPTLLAQGSNVQQCRDACSGQFYQCISGKSSDEENRRKQCSAEMDSCKNRCGR